MRLINDREEKREFSEHGFLAIASQSIFSALGLLTALFAPLPVIAAHLRFPEPWPKVTSVLGALLAISVLPMAPAVVILLFVFSLFVADEMAKGVAFWRLLWGSIAVATVSAFVVMVASAALNQLPVDRYWGSLVDRFVEQIQSMPTFMRMAPPGTKKEILREIIFHEGPFMYLSAMVLSLWFSLGLAAHLNWTPSDHAYSGANLRKIRFPYWASLLFALSFVGDSIDLPVWGHVCGGCFSLAGTFMYLQGTIWLSERMARAEFRPFVRAILYSVSFFPGFYLLIVMGALAPWFLRRKDRLEEAL
jgi:hypothetical protein